jgi:hypothetical protein
MLWPVFRRKSKSKDHYLTAELMSTLTIAESWIELPSISDVPSRTMIYRRENAGQSASMGGPFSVGQRLVWDRAFRLELLVATAIIGFACFAWQTLSRESILQEVSANQSRSIAKLTEAVSRQDRRMAGLNQSIERRTRELAIQMNGISSQLEAQGKAIVAIESRLSRVEVALRGREQAELAGQ